MGSAFFISGRSDCEAVEERLEAYLSGAMPEGEERTRIAAHLSDCPDCRERVTEYTRVCEALSFYRAAPLPERPGDWRAVRARLETSLESRLRWNRPVFGGRAIAAGLTAVLCGFMAVALPRLQRAETTPVPPVPAGPSVQYQYDTPRGEPGSVSRRMGFVTVGKGENTLSVAPAFLGAPIGRIVPLVVEVGSEQDVREARIEVRPTEFPQFERVYRYSVRLARGETSRFLVYPYFGHEVDNHALKMCEVTLTAPGRHQKLRLFTQPSPNNSEGWVYIGNRPGAINPRITVSGRQGLTPAYVAPIYAPHRAIGYGSARMVVLAAEAATLSASQWQALREWVTLGGHLVLASESLLDVPELSELVPVRKVTRKAFGTTFAPVKDAMENEQLLPPGLPAAQTTITQRRRGMGMVSFLLFDPTADAFRRWDHCERFWQKMLNRSGSTTPDTLRKAGYARLVVPTGSTDAASNDAFRLSLPSVQVVLFLFLGYFVLVVPVTFAVLKHTRRMNLAWVTGPVLAAVFAGGVFLLTARLYFMPTARRTAGVIVLHSGERSGRFAGNTELFLPKAGRYELPLGRADFVEAEMTTNRMRPLDSLVNSEGQTTATVSGGNLAFRRVYHEQSVELPGAISVELEPDGKGNFTGWVENATGKPLLDAAVRRIARKSYTQKKRVYFRAQPVIARLGDLPPGRTKVQITKAQWGDYYPASGEYNYAVNYNSVYETLSISKFPTLIARIPGEPLGPRIGQDFSGDRSVTVVVGMDTQKTGGKE